MKPTAVGGKAKTAHGGRSHKTEDADTFKSALKAKGDAIRSKGRASAPESGNLRRPVDLDFTRQISELREQVEEQARREMNLR
jgi:hypothetical protein